MSDIILQYVKVFTVGGLLCVIAQILIDKTKLTPARILVSYVVAGVILSGFGWYGMLADFASMGAKVPLLGFGHCLAEGVRKGVDEKGLFGVLTGGLTATSAGICSAILFALIFSLFCKSRRK